MRRTALFVAALAIVAFPVSAAGELQPNDISRAGVSGSTPRIASDGSGNIVAVWREVDGDTSAIGAAFRPAGGAWSSPRRISEPAPATESPKLAMDALGNAVAVWQRSTGHDSVVQAAVRPAGGDWSDPQNLSATGEVAFNVDVAIRAGRATAVWMALDDRRTGIKTSSRAIDGAWAPQETISGPIGNTSAPVVAVDDAGAAVAAWRWSDGAFLVVQAATRSRDGVWATPEVLSGPGRSASQPLLAMDANGDALVAWLRFNGSWTAAQVVSRPAGENWGEARNLSERGGNARRLDLAVNSRGDAIVTWTQTLLASSANLWSAFRKAGSNGWARTQVTESWYGLEARVALDEQGNATALWAGSFTTSASFKPAGEAWQPNFLLSEYEHATAQPAVTTQRPENATAVWVRNGEAGDFVQAVSYDVNTYKEQADEEEEDEEEDEGEDEGDLEGETFRGTPGSDRLVGTPGSDVFYGYGGRDVIDGRGGRDIVYGGRGRDVIIGGTGSDRIYGGEGSDRISGGRGRDVIRGGLGSDLLRGNRGRDVLYGAAGLDVVDGGSGRDIVYGGIDADRISGGRNIDRLFGGDGRDRIHGGTGSDLLTGGHGVDVLSGDSGNDQFRALDRRADVVFGGTGLDFYSLDRWLDRARSIESRL
ncbi:MAG TPA: calcium-binding protein [Gaiellaceae bacterium]|nr:calcium-binding protein [Gaiellaceae bacterium]